MQNGAASNKFRQNESDCTASFSTDFFLFSRRNPKRRIFIQASLIFAFYPRVRCLLNRSLLFSLSKMTSTTKKMRCKKCTTDERLPAVVCNGCQCYFCVTCIVQHRQELAAQITNVAREHEPLRQQLDQKCDAHTALKHIDEWEQASMD